MKYLVIILLLCFNVLNGQETIDNPATKVENKKQSEEEKFFSLEENIWVSVASKKPKSLRETHGIVNVYTSKQIEDYGFLNLSDTLNTIPGMRSGYALTQMPNNLRSRGIANATLILVDGLPMIQKNEAYGLNNIPITIGAVDKLEVIRGPGSVLWGANAFMGIVNIVTKDADEFIQDGKKSGYKVTMRTGNWNTNNFYFNSGAKLSENLNIYVGGSYESTLGYVQKTNSTFTPNGFSVFQQPGNDILAQSNQDAINSGNTTPADLKIPWDRGTEGTKNRRNLDSLAEFMVKANWKPYEGGNLKISLITNRNKFYFPISGALNQSDRNNNGYYEYPYNIYSIKYSHTFSDTLNTTLTIGKYELTEWEHFLRAGAYYSSPSFSNQNSLSGSSSRRNLDPDVTSQGNYLEKLSNLTIDWNVSYTGIKNNTILIGATYLEQGIPKLYFSRSTSLNNSNQITQDRLPEWYDQGPVKSKIQSLYVQDSIRIHEKLNLQVGARYDKHYLSSSFINPQSSLIWNITSRLTGRTLYSRGFREPSYNNLFSYNGTVGSITYAGIDPDPKDKDPRADSPKKLNPEKSESYESQISYYLLSDWKLNINLARSNIRDLITPYYSNSQWTWYFNNGRQQIDSLEGEISYNLSKKLLFMEKGSVFFYNVTYNKITNFVTETESRDYTASIVNSNNPPSEWAKNDFKLYTQDQRLIVKTDPRYWMNIGGVIRFLENYAFNFTAFYSAERYFGGYKGLNSGTRFYPETDKDYLNIIAACGSNQTSSCPAIVNVNTRKNGVRIGSYYTLNIGLSYDKIMENGSKIRISLQINNLFDRIYNAPYTNFSSTGAQILPNPQPGRQIYLTLTGYF